jgi:hypothetical protein
MEAQGELSNTKIVTIAVYNLGGSVKPVELEDIAIEAYKMAPQRFSWKKYPDRIDLRIVHYSVQTAVKPDSGFLNGNSKFGYMVTKVGLEWIASIEENEIFTKTSRKFSTSDLTDKEKLRLQRTHAYEKFLNGEIDQITSIDFREFTRVNDNFPRHLREQRFAKIQNVTDQDEALSKVWGFLKNKFLTEE